MSRNSSRLVLTGWLVIVGSPLLGAPNPRAAAPRAPSVQATVTSPGSLSQFWQHLTSLWAAIGCGADPNGVKCASDTTPPAAVTATTPANIGCGADPDGLH